MIIFEKIPFEVPDHFLLMKSAKGTWLRVCSEQDGIPGAAFGGMILYDMVGDTFQLVDCNSYINTQDLVNPTWHVVKLEFKQEWVTRLKLRVDQIIAIAAEEAA